MPWSEQGCQGGGFICARLAGLSACFSFLIFWAALEELEEHCHQKVALFTEDSYWGSLLQIA